MPQGIVIAWILEHSHEHCGFLDVEFGRLFAEVYIGGSLDTHRIVKEVEAVEIHAQNLFFCIESLELDCNHPLYRLLHGPFEHVLRGL